MAEARIKNDEQYNKSLEWLVKKATELEDPLLTDEKRSELMPKYDLVASEVEKYRHQDYLNSMQPTPQPEVPKPSYSDFLED